MTTSPCCGAPVIFDHIERRKVLTPGTSTEYYRCSKCGKVHKGETTKTEHVIVPVDRDHARLFQSRESAQSWGAMHVRGFPGWQVTEVYPDQWAVELMPVRRDQRRFYPKESR